MRFLKSLLRKPTATIRKGQTLREALNKMVSEDVSTLAVLDEHGRTIGALNQQALRYQNLDNQVGRHYITPNQVFHLGKYNTLPSDPKLLLKHKHVAALPVACMQTGKFLGLAYRTDVIKALRGDFIPKAHNVECAAFTTAPIHDG